MKTSDKHPKWAFTLTEILVALAVVGFVAAAGLAAFVTLQRGFVYMSAWSDAKANQVRLLDSLPMDLRAASAIVESSAKGSALRLTMKIPKRYAAYETAGFRAGDPMRPSSPPEPLLDGSCSAATGFNVVYPNPTGFVTVTYELRDRSAFSANTKVVYRKLESYEREIASFPSNVEVYLEDASKNTNPVTTSKAVVITVNAVTDNRYANRSKQVTSQLTRTVFLRQLAFQ